MKAFCLCYSCIVNEHKTVKDVSAGSRTFQRKSQPCYLHNSLMFTVGLLDHYILDNCLLAHTLLGAIVNLQTKWLGLVAVHG